MELIQAKLCKNPLKMYTHYILPTNSSNPQKMYLENLGYCGVCQNLAFMDNNFPNLPYDRKTKPYPDSKINNKNFVQCGNDTL